MLCCILFEGQLEYLLMVSHSCEMEHTIRTQSFALNTGLLKIACWADKPA
jgi:hypothetical protein